MLYRAMALCLAFVWASASSGSLRAEDRTIDGTNNNLLNPSQGAANTRLIRGFPNEYEEEYAGTNIGAMITEFTIPHRPNARDISNLVSAQTDSVLSARGLSDYLWIWGQFLDHDISLSTTSNGAVVNGSEPIPIHSVQDPLFPSGSVPFTRHNFVTGACVVGPPGCRQQINEVTSYIDGSGVYGTDNVRAAALRTAGGTGAQLRTSTDNLLPLNDGPVPFPNENNGPLPDNLLFLAGDIRANENVLLTSMHTLFVQEHNRLVDKISILQPGLLPEEQYQLARKIVGAEIQIITYNEFLPALIGPAAPNPANYSYDNTIDPTITQSFAHAAYRFGHSTVSPNLRRVSNDGASLGSLSLSNAFFDPTILSGDASQLDLLLKGAATQISQEVDTKVVDELRNMLFGPPGAGGMDLAAINIHRGRDHGLPDYNTLRFFYDLPVKNTVSEITSDPTLVQAIETAYDIVNFPTFITKMDGWVGGLAEDHQPGSSVGQLFEFILLNQFERLRDGDRLFYLSDDLGLYSDISSGPVLLPSIRDIIDLDNFSLSDVIKNNTTITNISDNVFFAAIPGDFDGNHLVNDADLAIWNASYGVGAGADSDGDGDTDGYDLQIWQQYFGGGPASSVSQAVVVPEPASSLLLALALLAFSPLRPAISSAQSISPAP